MRAVEFNWLNQFDDFNVSGGFLLVNLSHTNQYGEVERVTAKCELENKTVDGCDFSNPENSHDIEGYCLKSNFAIVQDFDNVHAIIDMPFQLTGDQFNTINDYLGDMPL